MAAPGKPERRAAPLVVQVGIREVQEAVEAPAR
jgi:hypothetical protein